MTGKAPNGIANGVPSASGDDGAPKSHHSLKGILLIIVGSFSFSVMFLLVKVMASMNTFTLVFYRSVVQIAISLVDLYKKKKNPLGPNDFKIRFYLVLRAVFGAGAVMAWFFGIQILPLPDAVTLQFTTPPFAAAFAVCMVGEQWKRLDIIGAIVCLSGVALIAHPTWLFGSAGESEVIEDDVSSALKAAAVLVTTAGAAMAGCAYVCVRKIGEQADAVVMVFYYGILSLPMTAIGSKLYMGDWNVLGDIQHFSFVDYFLLLLVGFAGYGGQWFTNLGLQNETAATVSNMECSWLSVSFLRYCHFHLAECIQPLMHTIILSRKLIHHRQHWLLLLKLCGPLSLKSCFYTKNSIFGHSLAHLSFWVI